MRLNSLRSRLILMLSLALLPIGSVAVYQTMRVVDEAQRLAERDVMSRTVRAAGELQALLQRAFGAAEALGAAALQEGADSDLCDATMRGFVEASLDYSFAGFIALDGMMTCTNTGENVDYRGTVSWESFLANPRPTAFVSRRGAISREAVLVVFVPVFDPETGALLGGQAVSTPEWLTEALLVAGMEDLALALVSPDGTVLASSTGLGDTGILGSLRPETLNVPTEGRLVSVEAGETSEFPIALVPLIEDWIFVAGLWNNESRSQAMAFPGGRFTAAFPVLMWGASLLVAFFTVNSLVVRNLRRLSWLMRRFKADEHGLHFIVRPDEPREFVTIAENYNAMVDRIAEDRETLQDNVREKELLLREVHHRVKNNLQLIASILNMQIRNVASEDARRVLGRVQDRVMSLSTIHKALYSGARVDDVRADLLLADIVNGVLNVGLPRGADIDVAVDLTPLSLDPDRAVPLSLLATEAVTNAAKHIGAPEGEQPRIGIVLSETQDEDQVVFSVTNTCGPTELGLEADDGSTLGARLIEAFASQLSGDLRVEASQSEYQLSLTFRRTAGEAA